MDTGGAARFVGRSVRRKEDRRLVTGHGRYVDDVAVPGCLHAAFVRSDVARARFRIDVSRARAADGVRAVFTAADLDKVIVGSTRPTYLLGDTNGPPLRTLAASDVRYVGEPLAMVIATSRYLAEDACDLVDVDYESEAADAVLDLAAAVAGGPKVHPELSSNVAARVEQHDDAVEVILANARHVVTETFVQRRQNATPMETHGIIGSWDPYAGQLDVWASSQHPHDSRLIFARALGIPEHRIRVMQQDIGGGFGQKAYLIREEVCAVAGSFLLGRPVRWIEDRRENLVAGLNAREERMTVSLALDADGTMLAARLDHLAEAGAYPSGGPGIGGLVGRMFPGPYRIPHVSWTSTAVWTNTSGRAPYRAPWNAESLAREAIVDVAARRLGMDPIELRRRNVLQHQDLPWTSATGTPYDGITPAESLEQAAALVDYGALRTHVEAARARGRIVGIGIGMFVEPSAFGSGISGMEGATLRVEPTGKVNVFVGTATHGQSLETTLAQVAADHLGVDVEDVSVHQGDTESAPYGGGTGGSRSAVLGGAAVAQAAAEIHERVVQIAAHLLEADPRDLQIEQGRVSVRGTPTRGVDLAEVAAASYAAGALPPGMPAGLEVATRFQASIPFTLSNGCHICAVDIDPGTGEVKVTRYAVSEDCGVMINPMVVEGQIAGGVVQGLAGVLYEHLAYDAGGNPLATTFMDYLLPTAAEAPSVEIAHLQTPSPSPGGYKGMGEGGVLGSVPAVCNAVADALAPLGVTATSQPFSPSTILELLA